MHLVLWLQDRDSRYQKFIKAAPENSLLFEDFFKFFMKEIKACCVSKPFFSPQKYQGLIHKEKVHIDCEKGAHISIFSNKIATMMTQYYH